MLTEALEALNADFAAPDSPSPLINNDATSPQIHVAAFFGCKEATNRLEVTNGRITEHGDNCSEARFLWNLEAGNYRSSLREDDRVVPLSPMKSPASDPQIESSAMLSTSPPMSEVCDPYARLWSLTPARASLDPPVVMSTLLCLQAATMIKTKLMSPGWLKYELQRAQDEALDLPEELWNPLKLTSSPPTVRHALCGQLRLQPFAAARCAAPPRPQAQAA